VLLQGAAEAGAAVFSPSARSPMCGSNLCRNTTGRQPDISCAWEAIEMLWASDMDEAVIAQMMGGNAAQQFGIGLVQTVS
jgi:hypothetical protein